MYKPAVSNGKNDVSRILHEVVHDTKKRISRTMPSNIIPYIILCESGVAGLGLLAYADMPKEYQEQIYGNMPLIACCVLGSVAGALLAVALFSSKKEECQNTTMRKVCLKFGASQLSGMVFTPMIVRYINMVMSADNVVGISAAVAFLSVGTLQKAFSVWERHIEKKLGIESKSGE